MSHLPPNLFLLWLPWKKKNHKCSCFHVTCPSLGFDKEVPLHLLRETRITPVSSASLGWVFFFFFFGLIVCLFVLSVCACLPACVCMSCSSFRATGVGRSVRLCVTSPRVYSLRSKWTRYFPPLCVAIGLSAGNSVLSLHSLAALSYLNRKLRAGSLAYTHL